MKLACTLVTSVLLCVLAPNLAFADVSNTQVFETAVTSLKDGAYDSAIDYFEALSDRGFSHPDASFNRAIAYLERSRTPQAQTGDLGRAAAALSECLHLRPRDAEAQQALDQVRTEISRKRAREGATPLLARPSLSRAVIELIPEGIWALLALVASATWAIGLLLRGSVRRLALAGNICIGIGCACFAVSAGFAIAARYLRQNTTPAVVVAAEARLLDASGKPKNLQGAHAELNTIPEGAEIYVREERAGLMRVEWGNVDGWVMASTLRKLQVLHQRG